MYQIDFNKPIHIHFMGIGGISMSGLAEILIKEGFSISGSDIHTSDIIKHLEDKGAKVYLSQTADNITDDIDLVVYTAAINFDTNEEYKEAIRRNIPVMKRATLLGQMMHNYQNAIAVSGTHGKTTTTSMLSYILLAGNTDPTISVGGILDAINGNIRVGHSETFVTEACEYTNSFLEFFPKISIILNIEEDHMDFFKDLDDIRHSFREFAHKLPDYGYLIINGEIENIDYIVDGLKAEYATFGLENDCIDTDTMKVLVDEFAEKVGMKEYLDKEPSNLSGGQKQRVAIAGALARKPKILIMDEATAMLDPKGRRDIRNLIKKMKDENPGLTIISITHDIDEAYQADKVIVLSKRPSRIKKIYDIKLTINGKRTPYESRKAKEFKDYFDDIWKELTDD